MAELKRKTLLLSSGKQIKLFGNSLAIGRTLEIGEGYIPNILSLFEQQQPEKTPAPEKTPPDKTATADAAGEGQEAAGRRTPRKKNTVAVSNPHRLTPDEIMEIADYTIRLWLDLKDNIRAHGVDKPTIFNRE